jgi:pantoate--beta-alanine ligase
MLILNSPEITQQTLLRWKLESQVALVPTMGCLHEGHVALIRKARELCPKVVVSIFVNPMQFGPTEDFARYPRRFDEDAELLKSEKVSMLFAPAVSDMYPGGFDHHVRCGKLAKYLCGASRPGHFDGVATVCLKLFSMTGADVAVFGEKDFQQLRIVQQFVADFNLPLSIVSHPIVREADGLALSSRNQYLSSSDRKEAAGIYSALEKARQRSRLEDAAAGTVVSHVTPFIPGVVEYAQVCSEHDLVPVAPDRAICEIAHPRLFIATRLGHTRLIDNMSLS